MRRLEHRLREERNEPVATTLWGGLDLDGVLDSLSPDDEVGTRAVWLAPYLPAGSLEEGGQAGFGGPSPFGASDLAGSSWFSMAPSTVAV